MVSLTANPWVTEHAQRDADGRRSPTVRDEDVVLITDVDEFLRRGPGGTFPVAALSQQLLMYAADWLVPEQEHLCSVVASGLYMHGKLASAVRDGRYGYHALRSAGRHITWVGGVKGQQQKFADQLPP